MDKKRLPWYKMDNTSFMYSAIQKEYYSAIYRFSAVMKADVDPEALQRAIDKTMRRFPGFRVRIKQGVFWYYFEPNTAPGPVLKRDVAEPCRPVRFNEDNNWLVRFYYYGRRISLELFHALADGAGAICLLRCLVAQYLRELGVNVPVSCGLLDLNEKSTAEEWEDAYSKYAGKQCRVLPLIKRAYLNIGTPEKFYTFNVTMGFMPVDVLKSKARELGVSITEYLCAALMYVLIEKQRRENPEKERPVALTVPVNLRAFFPSKTLRNFILTVQPWVDPSLGNYSFPQIAERIHHYMRLHCNEPELRAYFSQNVRMQNNLALKLVPSFIKGPVMSRSYRERGLKPFSATMTNPGIFRVPDEMKPYIEHVELIQGQAVAPRPHVAALSYENIMNVTFSGTMRENELERDFFRFLVKQGIPVHIESNRHCPERAKGEV